MQSDEYDGSSYFSRVGYVEEYNQTEGTGFNYNVSFWTDIHLGDLVIDNNTTTGELSQAIVENNESFRYGDLIMFIYGDTLLDSSAETKENRCFTLRVVLDESDTQKLSGYDFNQSQTGYYVSGFSQHEDTLACSIQISNTDELIQNVSDIGGVWIHSRLENGKLLTSPQTFEHYNHQMVAEHSDESYRKHTYESFGYKSRSKLDPTFYETYDEPLRSWHYGDSFTEHSGMPGCNTDPHDTTGLGLQTPTFDSDGYLIVNNGILTIPNVPKDYYVRIEYSGSAESTSTNDNDFSFEGMRSWSYFLVDTYKAQKDGVNNYQLDIINTINIRFIVITPYRYAKLEYGNMEEDEYGEYFEPLSPNKKYVMYNVKRVGTLHYYYTNDEDPANIENEEHLNPTLPILKLNIDGELDENDKPKYVALDNYNIKYSSTAPHIAHINNYGEITLTGIAGSALITAELVDNNNIYYDSEIIDEFEIRIYNDDNTLRLAKKQAVKVNEKFPGANSDKNLDNITLTAGGWNRTPTYIIPNVPKPALDCWNRAVNFQGPIKPKVEILDGFNQYSIGKNAAKSESVGEFHPEYAFANNITPWRLPCRGAYFKFESVKPGIVTIYIK